MCENQDLESGGKKMILTLSDCVTKRKKEYSDGFKSKLKVVWLNCTRKVCPDYQKNIS